MTEAWRLTAGDDFFKDKFTGALVPYVFINSLIFKAAPDITLLGFRQLQYILTILSLLVMSFALFRVTRQFWFQPLIFSLFAFTGLDPVGMISNLSYQTYPHLFITLHLALFIIGLTSTTVSLKRLFFLLSGASLWLISFSLLHLSLVVFSPVLIFLIFRKLKIESLEFTFKDLCFVLAPFLFFWTVFIVVFNKAYVQNILSSVQLMLSTSTHNKGSLLSVNWEALKHVVVVALFLIAWLIGTKLPRMASFFFLTLLALVMYIIIDTSLFGFLMVYYQGLFGRPMWFTAFLVTTFLMASSYFLFKVNSKKQLKPLEVYVIILIVPCIIMSLSNSIFSTLGILTVLFTSIPAVAGITCMALSLDTIEKRPSVAKMVVLLLLFSPFYYTTALADWECTFFDVPPEKADSIIDEGFGKGIRTQKAHKEMCEWIRSTSKKYSDSNDFILSYTKAPMVHMIAKRRPCLDDSYICLSEFPYDYLSKAIDFMKEHNREPRLAYISTGFADRFSFPFSDPLTDYVMENMVPIDNYNIQDYKVMRLYIDKSYAFKNNLTIISQ